MKLWLIKLGKVLNAIKRDGVFYGLSRAVHGLFALFGTLRVPAGDILIVTSGIGDSARYRAHHVAEELRKRGFMVSVTVQDNPFLARYIKKFDVFIFHRVLYLGSARRLYDSAKESGKTIIFETDDLVYDPKFLVHMDFFNQMQEFEKMQYKDGVGGEMVRDPYVHIATTTTTFLAQKLEEEGKKVFVVPNKLSDDDLSYTEPLYSMKSYRETGPVVIGYFSGVISHNKDFAVLTPVFVRLFEKYSHVQIAIYGPLDLDESLAPYKERFIQNAYVPREKHFANVSRVDINIAPLEIDNPFCTAKSELKFFEAGAVGVPTVATATQTFREAITDGYDGFYACTEDEWVEKLSVLIESPALREEVGRHAHETTHKRYTTDSYNAAYVRYLRNVLSRGSIDE